MTVADAVTLVDQKKLVLPGIQRNFVWKPAQIALLFDSLVRGYPIGTMLLWRTKRSEHPQLQFRRLVTEYQGPDTLPANAHVVADLPVLGVLDGQQRLTALSIGLQGTYAATSQAPGRSLYIDLDQEPGPDEGSDDETDGSGYSFKFLADEAKNDSGTWFKVADARGLGTDAQSLNKAIKVAGHAADAATRSVLKKLAVALNTTESVHFDIEESGDLDRVLNIFGRTNGEGTRLTSVDLLVSTATAKWTTLNARAEVTNLRKSMNSQSSEPFRFTDDRIMKAGLVLLDVPAPKLRVELFLHGNKAKALENMWPEFSRSMITAAAMLASFGLSGRVSPARTSSFLSPSMPTIATCNRPTRRPTFMKQIGGAYVRSLLGPSCSVAIGRVPLIRYFLPLEESSRITVRRRSHSLNSRRHSRRRRWLSRSTSPSSSSTSCAYYGSGTAEPTRCCGCYSLT